ncbi:MAG TPA: hypothetical protein VMT51_09055 [Dongiaceae bacterium]|nr:hypothetical protein [Dongiaceae bacterium]
MPVTYPEKQSLYAVEVSGWDAHEQFFVEKTELYWDEESGKHVHLVHAIPSGALIFLRLLDPLSIDRTQPVPYRAECLDENEIGQRVVRLCAVSPPIAG